MRVRFSCKACLEVCIKDVVFTELGMTVGVEHKEDCPFLKAIDQRRISNWLSTHGYPIQVSVEK